MHPAREIEDDADDKAHFDEEAPKVIKFIHASKGHEFMNEVVLTDEQAPLSHEVFKAPEEEEAESQGEGSENGESKEERKAKKDII